MYFMMQLDLKDVSSSPVCLLPRDGWLLFFIDETQGAKAHYIKAGAQLHRQPYPTGTWESGLRGRQAWKHSRHGSCSTAAWTGAGSNLGSSPGN